MCIHRHTVSIQPHLVLHVLNNIPNEIHFQGNTRGISVLKKNHPVDEVAKVTTNHANH